MNLLVSRMNEQQRRWYAGLESIRVGHGADPNADPYLLLALVYQRRFDAIVALIRAGCNPNPIIAIGDKTGRLMTLTHGIY